MKEYKARLGEDGRLTEKQLVELIKSRQAESSSFKEFQAYFLGKNPGILKKEEGKKIPVPYARTLILTTVGFMYKQGLIRYGLAAEDTENQEYLEQVLDALKANSEPLLNTELGQDQSTYGEAYELHYQDENGQENFARVLPQEFIPVYSYEIKPRLIAGIRFYDVVIDGKEKTEVDVYYPDLIQKFNLKKDGVEVRDSDQIHPYGQVPVAIFKNNTSRMGDIEPIKGLIDAYDSIVSAYADDEQKFAEAILLLFGRELDDEAVERLDRLRLVDGLDKDTDDIRYLTKDENQSTRLDLLTLIRQEIYRQDFIPDMTDPSVLGQKSGEAFQYLFANFELMASVKESYFAQGIRERIKLVTMGVFNPSGESKNIDAIKVEFSRNLPKDSVMWAGIVRDLWGMLPASALVVLLPFVDDPEGLLEEMENEQTGDGISAEDVRKAYKGDNAA